LSSEEKEVEIEETISSEIQSEELDLEELEHLFEDSSKKEFGYNAESPEEKEIKKISSITIGLVGETFTK